MDKPRHPQVIRTGGADSQGRQCNRRGKNQASYFSRVSICDGSSL